MAKLEFVVLYVAGWVMGITVGIAFTLAFAPACQGQELYSVATLKSYHEDRSHGYNEKNLGVGVQWQINKDLALVAGEYKNSFTNKSEYFGVSYTPFHRDNWSMGGLVVDVNGYDYDNLKKFQPVAIPLLVYRKDKWLVNIPFVPPFRKQGIVAVQIGYSF